MEQQWNWKEQRAAAAFLALEDGSIFRGYSIGASVDKLGETVFNTGMTGYQEILSDPSYAGQFIAMTYPEIGSYGTATVDMESNRTFCNGLLIHHDQSGSNWRNDNELRAFLIKNSIPALAGIDTRALTIKLRTQGALKGFICTSGKVSEAESVAKAKGWEGLVAQDYATACSTKSIYEWDPDDSISSSWGAGPALPAKDLHVVAYDFGIKWNILRSLRRSGMRVTVVPAQTPASEVLKLNPDGVFLSNGPADPQACTYAIAASREILGKKPMMGICLGHQILSLACGAKTYKLKFGHHGCNHPIKNLEKGTVEITSQNHNFAVDEASIQGTDLKITHINLNDNTVAGVRHLKHPMFAVQYHPEAAPGPHDPFYLFAQFRALILANR